MTIPVDQLYFTVVRITTHTYNDDKTINHKEKKYGTGFFYSNANHKLFLITARHVIINEREGYHPNAIRIILHSNQNDLTQNDIYDIHLYEGACTKLWIEPDPLNIDVIAIPLDYQKLEEGGFVIKSFAVNNLLPQNRVLHIGEDVLIVGYSLGTFYDTTFNLPVIRNGIIASPYPVPYQGNQYFLVDAQLHPGTSGGPVITKFKNMWQHKEGYTITEGWGMYLLGINASTAKIIPNEMPLGLNATYFAEILEKMTSLIK